MWIEKVTLSDFRNHKKVQFTPDEKTTIIFGPNGAGKTNLIEAVSVLSLGKSYRAHNESDVINFNF